MMPRDTMKYILILVTVAGLGSPSLGARGRLNAAPAAAQARGQTAAEDQPVSPGEVQRLMDAYALMQAQDQLKISEEQFSQFLSRYKALQDIRRKDLQERARLINEMRKILNGGGTIDDAGLAERVKALQELDTRSAADIRKAYDAIDQMLDPRQQAKFRVFEENMERRKLEFVTRARQSNRPKQQ
jgi:hypothetical protein